MIEHKGTVQSCARRGSDRTLGKVCYPEGGQTLGTGFLGRLLMPCTNGQAVRLDDLCRSLPTKQFEF